MKEFEELLNTFLKIKNGRFIRVYYNIKKIEVCDCYKQNDLLSFINYFIISKHTESKSRLVIDDIDFGSILTNNFITHLNVTEYLNLKKIFVKQPVFLKRVNTFLEKEILRS